MTNLTCDKCDKTFTSKHSLDYHKKKNVCTKKTKKFKCKYCGNCFSFESSLSRHVNHTCKKRESEEDADSERDELLKKFTEMQENHMRMMDRINKLENENKKLKSQTVPSTINNGIVNNYNGDVNNITVNVVPFGKEDLSKISKNDLLKVFRSGFNSALQLTETTHFNPKYPEYHNVYISNMKNKYAMTYDGSDWALVMKDELIDKMYNKKRDYIEDNMDDFYNSLMPSQINALHRWLNVDDDHHYVQKVKNDMKLMLYNKRKMVLDPKPPQVSDIDEIDYTVRVIKEPKHNVSEHKITKSVRIASRNGRYRKTIARRRKNKMN